MDVEQLMHKLRGLLGELGVNPQTAATSPYMALAADSLVSVLNLIRAAELTVDAGAARTTVDAMLREHLLGRMQREAAFMARLCEQPAIEMEATLRDRQSPSNTNARKARPRPGAYSPSGH